MDDPRFVRGDERRGDAERDVDDVVDRQRPVLEALAQRLAVDMLAGDVADVVLNADVEQRDDVRMIEQRRATRLAL